MLLGMQYVAPIPPGHNDHHYVRIANSFETPLQWSLIGCCPLLYVHGLMSKAPQSDVHSLAMILEVAERRGYEYSSDSLSYLLFGGIDIMTSR